jgi:hypothetical protein
MVDLYHTFVKKQVKKIVTAQAEAFAVGNSAKKVCMWSVRSTRTPFLRIPLPQAE